MNIGRADYNDVVIADPSVSTSHAKLQRRDDVWVLTDLGLDQRDLRGRRAADGRGRARPGRHRPVRRGRGAVRAARRVGADPARRRARRCCRRSPPAARPPGARRPIRGHRSAASRAAPLRARAERPRPSGPPAWLIAALVLVGAGGRLLPPALTDGVPCTSPAPLAPTSASSARATRTTTSCSPTAASSSSRTAWAGTRPARSRARWRCASRRARSARSAASSDEQARRPGARRDPRRQRRDLRADPRGARQARHGHHRHGAGAAAGALPHRPGRRQPGLPAAERRVPAAHQGPLLRAGAGGRRAAHARSRRGCIPTAT